MSNPNIKAFAHLGGIARAKKLSKARRIQIAQIAGLANGEAHSALIKKKKPVK